MDIPALARDLATLIAGATNRNRQEVVASLLQCSAGSLGRRGLYTW